MSIKKKIVIVISIISIMMLCFSISSLAASYPYGVDFKDGDVIVFKDNPSKPGSGIGITININFISNNTDYNYICLTNTAMTYNAFGAYFFDNTLWNIQAFKTITIVGDQNINNDEFLTWLYENTVSGMPDPPVPPPHLEPSFWETVSGFFSEALASGTAIVNWMTITPIALIPLALYCLIVIIAITKRMIKG